MVAATPSLLPRRSISQKSDSHAHERRSTQLRSLIKVEEAVTDCPRSLTQPFIIDSSRLEVEVGPEASASEVTQFMQDSGLYHVGHGILERVSSSGIDWKEQSELLLELEKCTRHWGFSWPNYTWMLRLLPSEASSSIMQLQHMPGYRVVGDWDQEKNALSNSMPAGFSGVGFIALLHARKCLCLHQAQHMAIVLPHCKIDKRISLKMAEQKLYEFEV
ncbi:hypothetical protein SELMODRAFT_423676 [Selaginella moellendorffii]|uniref:Uncharacterized protein n=1 Tax=Selaginella moellendorffii TaxID=88036 RepID=D8SMH2_SELML|nr:hypothetical protein SELMODRAFT_423676 [Selaginella moellendorffii]